MAALDASECVAALMQRRYCSVLRTADATAVASLADAYIAGGIEVVEFTMTCPHRFEHIKDYARRGDCLVGLGTCLTVDDAARGIAAGASFVVSPVFGEEVVRECVRQNKVVIPGCNTPTEMYNAHLLGAQFQKLFPAPEGGSAWVRSTLGALPMLQIVPTAGITDETVAEYLSAGAALGGAGNTFLATEEEIQGKNWAAVQAKASAFVGAVKEWKAANPIPSL